MQTLLRARRESNRLAGNLSAALGIQNVGFAKKAKAAPKEDREANSKIQKLLKLLEPAEPFEIKLSAEDKAEWEKRAKEYNKRKMQEHREWQRDLTTRLKMKNAAIAALPLDLQAAARQPPTELFPLDRMVFTDTPPKLEDRRKESAQQREKRKLGTKRHDSY